MRKELLEKEYPKGTIIELLHMEDPQAPPKHTKGKVLFVDDIGSIHIQWENGSGLALIPEWDSFRVVSRGEE